MKAAVLTKLDQPLEIQSLKDPEPGPGQVRIRIHASGVCGTDLHVKHGHVPGIAVPLVLGHEPVGVIDRLGEGVSALKLGDRVGVSWVQSGCGRCDACQRQQVGFCRAGRSWMHNGGGDADFMIAEASGCTLLPDGLDWVAAAPLFCAGFTVMSGYRAANPRPGERVAVLGIGGLGHLAVQVARAMGHPVIAVTGTEAKRKEASALGADEVLVVREHAGNELMAMGGADVILSTTNSMEQVAQAVDGLRPDGRLIAMGVGGAPLTISPFALMFPPRTVKGGSQGARADMVDILTLAASGRVKPVVETYALDDVNRALDRLERGEVRYRAVIEMA